MQCFVIEMYFMCVCVCEHMYVCTCRTSHSSPRVHNTYSVLNVVRILWKVSLQKSVISKPDTRWHECRVWTWGGYCWDGLHDSRRGQKQTCDTASHCILVLYCQGPSQKSNCGMRSPAGGWHLLQTSFSCTMNCQWHDRESFIIFSFILSCEET